MTYNRKRAVLLALIAALAVVYVFSVVFEPERALSRAAAYTWLDPKLTGRIDRISVSGGTPGESVELVRKNGGWFVSHAGRDYPARGLRVEDFIGVLTRRASYPLRSTGAASHERLGLDGNSASRIVVSGGAGPALLDLLVGRPDNTGREVYLRRQGENEVRSGEDNLSAYIAGSRTSWYELRLFPESENLGLADVQRLTVNTGSGTDGAPPKTWTLTRNGREWTISGMEITDPDTGKIDAYIRGIIAAEGEDFSDSLDPADPLLDHSRVTLELGDGRVKTVRLSAPDENNRRFAQVSGSVQVYTLAGWAAERLFRDASFFEKQ
jgi:hypothetical protein